MESVGAIVQPELDDSHAGQGQVVTQHLGGRVDAIIMRIADVQLTFPAILIALILLATLGKGVDKIVIALIVVQWAYFARTVRATAMVERHKEYIEAATCLALSHRRIVFQAISESIIRAPLIALPPLPTRPIPSRWLWMKRNRVPGMFIRSA